MTYYTIWERPLPPLPSDERQLNTNYYITTLTLCYLFLLSSLRGTESPGQFIVTIQWSDMVTEPHRHFYPATEN